MALLSRLKALFGLSRLDHDLDDELRSHIEMRTQDNIATGMSPGEARHDARRRFGNSTLMKEDTRAMDIVGWVETLGQNLRYAARMLRRSPGFTIVAILTLALGIGANVAIFTVVHAVLLRSLPFPHPEQLVRIYDDIGASNTHDVGMSVPELWDLRDKSGVFQDICVIFPADANITGGDQPHRVQFLGTNANYFSMLGVHAQLGRTFLPSDALPGFSEPVVLSDAYWHRSYGADPNVIGKKIRIDSDVYTVAGVMPPDFRHPGHAADVDLWATTGFAAPPFPAPPIRAIRLLPGVMGRLKPGLTASQAQAQLNTFVAELTRQYPDEYPAAAGWSVRLVPTQQDIVGNVRTELLVLLAAVAFVLLIACVNLANLLLARSASRQREMAIRISIGASRARLLGQLLTESILLAAISGGIALVTVVSLKSSLLRLAPADLPRLSEISLSPGILLFAFFLSILTGIVFGLVPALQSVRSNQVASLREGTRGSGASRRQMKISRLLVGSEIALSLVLLIGAGLLVRSFWQLLQVRPGFEPRHLITAKLWLAVPNNPNDDPYFKPDKRADFHQEILRRISATPGVELAALGSASSLPMDTGHVRSPFILDIPSFDLERVPIADIAAVTPAYFSTLQSPLIAGRFFLDSDDTKGQQVAIIDETLARRYWPNSTSDAIGQRLQLGAPRGRSTAARNPWATIVGVVGNIKSDGFDAANTPHVYRPVYQFPPYSAVVFLRTSADIAMLGESVRAAVQQVDPTIPVFSVHTMDFILTAFLAERRFALELLGIFAAAALLLAAIGIYGVMAYTFSQRTNEIGIRVALGAQRRDILRIAFSEGAVIVFFGVIAGLLGSLALTRFLQSMLFSVKPYDPATFLAIATLLAAVTLFACFIPARRATRVDPLIALRHE